MTEEELAPGRSSVAVNNCIRQLCYHKNNLHDPMSGGWGEVRAWAHGEWYGGEVKGIMRGGRAELQKGYEFGPDSSLPFSRMNPVRKPRWIWD